MLTELQIKDVEQIRNWLPSDRNIRLNKSIKNLKTGRGSNGMAVIKTTSIESTTININEFIMTTNILNLIVVSDYMSYNNCTFENHLAFTHVLT